MGLREIFARIFADPLSDEWEIIPPGPYNIVPLFVSSRGVVKVRVSDLMKTEQFSKDISAINRIAAQNGRTL